MSSRLPVAEPVPASTPVPVESSSSVLDKGKSRATIQEPTETTPLLASRSRDVPSDDDDDDDDLEPTRQSNPTLVSTLTTVFLITLSVSILLVLLLLSLAYSYAAQAFHVSDDHILNNSLVFQGPDAIDVLNISQHGDIWLRLDGRVGFDAGDIIGVKPGSDDSLWLGAWKAIGRWGIRNLDTVSLSLSSINITSQYDPATLLASIATPPLQIPLTANPPGDLSWLTPMSIPVHLHPSKNVTAWLDFARDSWRSGYAVVQATISQADIKGGPWQWRTWRSVFRLSRSNLSLGLRMKIPALPNLPAPGDDLPPPSFADLVHLTHFSLTSGTHNLTIDASATMANPLPSTVTFTAPPIPFIAWIPSPSDPSNDTALIPLASVTSSPFALTHPNLTLSVHGNVLPISHSAAPAISSLISDYLSGVDHPIAITTPFELFADYIAHTTFPAPYPRPEVLHNVTIENMKVHPSGTTILASGIVHARLTLPEGMDITIAPSRVLPDTLIFDGLPDPASTFPPEPPLTLINTNADEDDAPPPAPLPNPLPPRAFARVRPSSWLAALTSPTAPRRDWGEHGSTTLRVSASFADVPLEVLPGREREFRSFVGKVIWGAGGGAVAGVQGVVAVSVRIEGLPIDPDDGEGGDRGGSMVLTGLPFQGSVRVGKK